MSRLVCGISENNEKCSLQLRLAQGDAIKLLVFSLFCSVQFYHVSQRATLSPCEAGTREYLQFFTQLSF